MADDWVEEDRAPMSEAVLAQQMSGNTGYNNSWSSNSNNSFGTGSRGGRGNYRGSGGQYTNVSDGWGGEGNRTPSSQAAHNQQMTGQQGYNNSWSSNSNNSFGQGARRGRGNYRGGEGRNTNMANDRAEEEQRTPMSEAALDQQTGRQTGYNNSWSSNSNNSFGPGPRRGRGNYRDRGGNNRGWDQNGGQRNTNSGFEGKSKLTFQIGRRDVGKLIGKAGCNINKLKDETQCVIDVGDENEDIKGSVDIHVTGEGEELIKKCRIAIEKHLGYSSLGNPDDGAEDEAIDWDDLATQQAVTEKKRWAKSLPMLKNFYVEHPDVKCMSQEQVKEFRAENHNIKVYNFDPESKNRLMNPAPAFHHAFEPYPEILSTIQQQGFAKPSPIQAQAWPYLLSGEDVIGIAQTGTGKTLAFLMPAFIHIDRQPNPRNERGGPNVLILCPTRELALQIAEEVTKYEYMGIKSVCVYGGGDRKKQMAVVTQGVQIIIATPGRLNDLVESNVMCVESITYLVLDEADRMLDMGFEPQIRKILLDIRPDRQTVMTSATWPDGVRRLATQYMSNPISVFIGSLDLAAVHTVSQQLIFVENGDTEKEDILNDFIETHLQPDDKLMVFVSKKTKAAELCSKLALKGLDIQSIHGDREQSDREQALKDMKGGTVRILIATDVASRGIDITDLTYVFNLDFPRNIEDYVHRVGRTGRAGKDGSCITLMEWRDRRNAQELIKILEEADQEVPEELRHYARKFAAWKEREANERRGYGRQNDGTCFKCSEKGHMSKDCPLSRLDDCYNCGEKGHLSKDCPDKNECPSNNKGRW